MTKENGIAKWINPRGIMTLVIGAMLTFTAGSVLLARDNAKAIDQIEKEQCDAKKERKKNSDDIQVIALSMKELVGELKVTNERTKQNNKRQGELAEKIEKLADKIE
jgi:peptidoglycan hydrolase CwlO-like protein